MTKIIGRGVSVVAVVAALLSPTLSSHKALAAEYPQVANLQKFTMESNYMSLPGYLRYLTFAQDGVWITRK